MATWIDQLGKVRFPRGERIGASFRGVPFYVLASTLEGGRRGVLHEMPGRDLASWDDLGRAKRGFPVEGYVMGPDYLTQRDALVRALEAPGLGELRHPYHGTRQVVAQAFRLTERVDDGGRAVFAITFIESGAIIEPAPTPEVGALVDGAATSALDAARDAFTSGYLVDGLGAGYIQSAEAALSEAGRAINSVVSPLLEEADALALFRLRVEAITRDAASMARDPARTAASVMGALNTLSMRGAAAARALLGLVAWTPPTANLGANTPGRVREAQNLLEIARVVRRAALIGAARLAVDGEYDSHQAALAMREQVIEQIDSVTADSDDETFAALIALRAEVIRGLPADDARLPRLITHVPQATTPALALAHQLYGNVDQEGDLVARNSVSNPMFVPGGEPLEVLASD